VDLGALKHRVWRNTTRLAEHSDHSTLSDCGRTTSYEVQVQGQLVTAL